MNSIYNYFNEMLSGVSEMSWAISIILLVIAALPLCALIFKPKKKLIKGLIITLAVSVVLACAVAIFKPVIGFFAVAIALPLYVYDLIIFKEYATGAMTVKSLVYGAICTALSFVLSYIVLARMPQGGSITLASMLPLIVYSYSFGVVPGFIAGVAYGLLQLIQDPYIIHPIQLIMDYPLPFALICLSGVFRMKNIRINLAAGTVLATIARYMCHVLSGVVFFAEYAGEQNVWIYSGVYNSFVFVEAAICIVILMIPTFTNTVVKIMSKK